MENMNLKSRLLPGNYDHKCNRSPNMTPVMPHPENSVRMFTVSDAIYPQNTFRWRNKINRWTGTKEKKKVPHLLILKHSSPGKDCHTHSWLISLLCPVHFDLTWLSLDSKARGTIRSSGLTSRVLQAIKLHFTALVLILRTSAWLKLVFQRSMWYWSEDNKRLNPSFPLLFVKILSHCPY